MKYDFSSRKIAIRCNAQLELDKVLKNIEKAHPELIWACGEKPTEFTFEYGFPRDIAFLHAHSGFKACKVSSENAITDEDFETNELITSEEYLDSFEELPTMEYNNVKVITDSILEWEELLNVLQNLESYAKLLSRKDIKKLTKELKNIKV